MDNYNNTRLNLNMSTLDVVVALADGNPGATVAMLELMKSAPIVDPQSACGGIGPLLNLDVNGIYGPRIWMLYKDVCGQDPARTIAVLRAYQLGMLSTEALDIAIDNYGRGIDVDDLVAKVTAKLDNFNVNALTENTNA